MKRIVLLTTAAALALTAALSGQSYVLKGPIASKPAFLTSVGQSADIEMVKVILERAAVPHKTGAQAKAAELSGSGAKTLIVVLGGSTKGLGAAGISADAELDRAKALLVEGRRLGMKIIGLHIGGEARRGELSDKFIQAAVSSCDYVIVVAEGDKDGFFGRLCGGKIPLDKVEKVAKVVEPLQKAFQ